MVQTSHARITTQRRANFTNLINIPLTKSAAPSYKTDFVPCVMLSNTMSLAPKMDEVQEFIIRNSVDIGFITETWLGERVADFVVSIPNYNIFRKDRSFQQHGGVCMYVCKRTHQL